MQERYTKGFFTTIPMCTVYGILHRINYVAIILRERDAYSYYLYL